MPGLYHLMTPRVQNHFSDSMSTDHVAVGYGDLWNILDVAKQAATKLTPFQREKR